MILGYLTAAYEVRRLRNPDFVAVITKQRIWDSNPWWESPIPELKAGTLNHSVNSLFYVLGVSSALLELTCLPFNSSKNRTWISFLSKMHFTVKLKNFVGGFALIRFYLEWALIPRRIWRCARTRYVAPQTRTRFTSMIIITISNPSPFY